MPDRQKTIRRRTEPTNEVPEPVEVETAPAPPARTEPPVPSPANPTPPAMPDAQEGLQDLADMKPEDFDALMKATTALPTGPTSGDDVSGTVVRVAGEYIFVDVGGKSEARMAVSELRDEECQVGATLRARVLQNGEDGIILSRSLSSALPEMMAAAMEAGIPVEGRVESRNTGGYLVNLPGARAFCPVSQIDRFPGRDLDVFIGQSFQFRILEIRDREVVVSRRAIQDEEARKNRDQIWDSIHEGDSLEGVITSVRDYGAFVDLQGVEGLIHKSELSWDAVENAEEVVKRWDRVRVRVLEMDRKRHRIALTMKDPNGGPWRQIGTDFVVDGVYDGTVTRIADYGAFVQLAEGLVGLVRFPNLSWDRVETTAQAVKVGDQVKVRILEADTARQRLDLGIRQATPDPSDTLSVTYPIGGEVTGVVTEVSHQGLTLLVNDEIRAWLPARDAKLPPGVTLHQRFRKGAHITANIVEVDRKRKQIRVSQISGPEGEDQEAMRQLKQVQKKAVGFGTLGDLLRKQ